MIPAQPSLVVDGQEVLNGFRTTRYLAAGLLADPRVSGPYPDCCLALYRDLGSPAIVSPSVDPAPWYTALEAESAQFLGGYLKEIEGINSAPVSRGFEERSGDGANMGLERLSSRQLIFRATLFAANGAAMNYGIRWLANRLAQAGDGCATSSVTVRLACPPADGSDDGRARYTLYRVGFTGGFTDATELPTGDGFVPFADVEWTMTAGDPWLYSDLADGLSQRLLAPQDYVDAFAVDTIASGLWTADAGFTAPIVSGGALAPNGTGQRRLRRAGVSAPGDRTSYRNLAAGLKATTGPTVASHTHSIAMRWRNVGLASASFLLAHVTQSTGGRVQLYDVRANGLTTQLLADVAAGAIGASTPYWLRAYVREREVVVDHWTTDPALGGTPAATTGIVTLNDDQAAQHFEGAAGIAFWNATDSAERIDDWFVQQIEMTPEEWLGLLRDVYASSAPPRHALSFASPKVGVTGSVVTIVAGTARDVTDVFVHPDPASYPAPSDYPWDSDFPMNGAGLPILPVQGKAPTGIRVRKVPAGATLVVDAARRFATLTTPDGLQVDGGYLLAAPDGAAFGWADADRLLAGRVVVEAVGYAADDGTALVTVQTRNRHR